MFTKCFIINLPYEFTKLYFVCFHHKSKLRFFKLYRIVRQFTQNSIVKLNNNLTDVITISKFSENILKKTLNKFFIQTPFKNSHGTDFPGNPEY